MSVTRFEHWPSLLSAFLDARRNARFEYGVHDCCLFAADALRAITGTDFAAQFRRQYYTRFGALRRMREHCIPPTVENLAAQVFASFGLREIAPGYAQRGDVLVLQQPHDTALGIIALDGMPVIAAERGWGISDRSHALKAWKV